MSPRRGSKPRRTDRLVVGRNVTMTLTQQPEARPECTETTEQREWNRTRTAEYRATLWDTPSLLSNEYRGLFLRDETVGAWSWDTTDILITPMSVASRRTTGWTAGVGFPEGARCFSSPQVQTCSGAHPASYPEYRGFFLGGLKPLQIIIIFI
jgi:hypothetical protein